MDDLEKEIYDSMHDMEGPSDCLLKEALDRLRTYREALEQAAEWFEEYGVEHERKASAVKFSNPKEASARRGKALRNMDRALILRQALKGQTMASPVIEAMARAMIAAEYGVLANQDSMPIAMERMRKSAVFVLKVLEENITDEMIDAGASVDPEDGCLPVFTAMLRAAREE